MGGSGVAPEAGIANIRLIGSYITGLQEANAIHHRNDAIHIKNNSWGPRDNGASLSGPQDLTKAALIEAVTNGRDGKGTILIWSAGNGGRYQDNANKNGFANSIYTIAVGALDEEGKRADYSEIGSNILITAPVGQNRSTGTITSDLAGDDGLNIADFPGEIEDPAYTNNFFGTSSSAPMIAVVVALMLEANPNLGWRDVQEILIRTAVKIDDTSYSWITNGAGNTFSDEYGAGLTDAYAAVMMAMDWSNLSTLRSVGRNLQIDDPIELPDANGGPFERSFSFEGSQLRVEQASLSLFLDHEMRGEILIELESPSGTVSQLVGRNDDDKRGYLEWTFSTVQFWGENADGTWKMRIIDGSQGDAGELWQASMELHGTELTPGTIPATPMQLTATARSANSIRLNWKDLAESETGYRIELAAGWGSPWQSFSTLGPNRTFHEIDFIPQEREIYFRVAAINGSEQSGYSNVAHAYTEDGNGAVLYQASFEPSAGYSVGNGLDSVGWLPFPEGFTHAAHGILADEFSSRGSPGHGQQAYIGKTWRGGSDFSSIGHAAPYDPIPNTTIQMKVLVGLSNSSNGASDLFGFNLYNQEGYLLCRIMFDNSNGDVYYATQRTIGAITGGYKGPLETLQKNQVYELVINLDLENSSWSGTIGGTTMAINLPLQPLNGSVDMNLGSVDAFWQVLDTSNAGNNYMLFDDLQITQRSNEPPEAPSEFQARAVSSTINYLIWEHNLLADQYEIQRSEDGVNNWTTIATVSEDDVFYIDPFLPINTEYFYRIRALSSAGDSPFQVPQSARTYTEYEDWKDGHRLEIDATDESDSDNDKIPLLAEYALRLNPRLISNGGLPRAVDVDGAPGLRYYRARKEINYVVEASTDLIHWTTEGVNQEGEILGLFITAVTEPDSELRFFRLFVSEKE
ncbi:S8 family serine peptidase [bacterium]|nr:S8 family serine peptidase [bacterium]